MTKSKKNKLKTRLDLLRDNFHTQTLGKILETELNLRITKRRVILFKPNDPNYDEAQKKVPELEKLLKNQNAIFKAIKDMIKEEEKSAKKV